MKKLIWVALLGLVLACGTAAAGDFNYVQAGYTAAHVQSRSGDSWGISASKELGSNFYVNGGFSNGISGVLDQGTVSLGAGFHTAVAPNVQAYVQGDVSAIVANRVSPSKYDYSAEGGLRWKVMPALELRGGVVASNLRSASFSQLQWRAFGGAEYALTKDIRAGLTVAGKQNDVDTTASVRLYF